MGKSKDLATGAAYQDQTESDTRYVNASGDTVTGNLNVSPSLSAEPYTAATFENSNSTAGHNYGGVLLRGDNQAHVRFLTNSTSWTGGTAKKWQIRVGAGNGQDNMHVYSWTKADDVLKINNSGHVQMPHQPAWCLQPNHQTTSYSQGDTQIPFAHSSGGSFGTFIQGGVTANSSGRVTIPVAGKYYCHASFRQENVSTNMQLSIWKNGTYIVRGGIWYNSEVYENISIARTFDLAANDYLEVRVNLGNANNISGYNDRLLFFSGFMIG